MPFYPDSIGSCDIFLIMNHHTSCVNETAKAFEEVQDLMPKNVFLIMTAAFSATAVFMLVCHFIESVGTPLWMFAVTAVIFAALILFCFLVKLRVSIANGVIRIRFIKKYEVRLEEVIDYKIGDTGIVRNYSGWGIKKVTFKNFICLGYDRAISLKLLGKRVFTISLSDPEGFAALLPPASS